MAFVHLIEAIVMLTFLGFATLEGLLEETRREQRGDAGARGVVERPTAWVFGQRESERQETLTPLVSVTFSVLVSGPVGGGRVGYWYRRAGRSTTDEADDMTFGGDDVGKAHARNASLLGAIKALAERAGFRLVECKPLMPADAILSEGGSDVVVYEKNGDRFVLAIDGEPAGSLDVKV